MWIFSHEYEFKFPRIFQAPPAPWMKHRMQFTTMYAGCSEQYWKQQKKRHFQLTKQNLFLSILIISFLGIAFKSSFEKGGKHSSIIENVLPAAPTEEQYQQCELNMRELLRAECDQLCKGELMSIPRPIMFRSCQHGCSRSFYAAAMVGCREGTEDDAFRKTSAEAHFSCSLYDNIDPKPNVQSTCKNYYRLGTKRGRQLGLEMIQNILENNWAREE